MATKTKKQVLRDHPVPPGEPARLWLTLDRSTDNWFLWYGMPVYHPREGFTRAEPNRAPCNTCGVLSDEDGYCADCDEYVDDDLDYYELLPGQLKSRFGHDIAKRLDELREHAPCIVELTATYEITQAGRLTQPMPQLVPF